MRGVAAALAAAALAGSAMAQSPPGGSLAGDWGGVVRVHDAPVGLIFHVKGAPGAWTATLDSPSQGAVGVPVAAVREADGVTTFDIAISHATYTARLTADGARLEGEWSQAGAHQPLLLGRVAARAAPSRPQTPQKPYPYREVEVAYDNPAEPVHLTGTLTLPNGPGPFPAVLLITGSGLQDRDETVFGHHPFLIWADYLTRRGIAVLRVDDRQMGGSTGDVAGATTADFATDVAAGVAWLRSRPDIDRRRVGLMGHSEGGIIAPMVAAKDPDIAFIIMLAGTGEPGEAVTLDQIRLANEAIGAAPETTAQNLAIERRLLEAVKDAPDTAAAMERLSAAWRADGAATGGSAASPLPPHAEALASPWFRFFTAYDPRPALAQVRCPVLALNGSKDTQIVAATNLPGIRDSLKADPDATVIELPGLNHLFQTAGTGRIAEYAAIEETVSPLALKTVGDWLATRVR